MEHKFLRVMLSVAVSAVFVGVMIYLYMNNETIQAVFSGMQSSVSENAEVIPEAGVDQSVSIAAAQAEEQSRAQKVGLFSMQSLIFVTVLQIFAFFGAFFVFHDIGKSTDPVAIRMSKMENAELFLDIPLYFGLFGTVLSFSLITFNPQISRLVAYSSTLIGIIFSVFLRLSLQYPLKQKLIELSNSGK